MSLSPLKHHQNYLAGMPFSVSDILHPALETQFSTSSSKAGFGGYPSTASNPNNNNNSFYKGSPGANGSDSQYSSIYYNNIQHSNESRGGNGGTAKPAATPSTLSTGSVSGLGQQQQQPLPPSSCTPSPSIHSPTGGLNSTAYSSFNSTPGSLNDPAVAAAAAAAYLNSYNGYNLHHTYPNSHHHHHHHNQHPAYTHPYHSHLNTTPGMLNGSGQFSNRYGGGTSSESSSFYSPMEDNPENSSAQLNNWYNSQVDTRIASTYIELFLANMPCLLLNITFAMAIKTFCGTISISFCFELVFCVC
jgi:hypothetical protein